jgi:surfeit locus 1 family protein
MPHFRPLPILTLFALPSLVVLSMLGNWQLQRMQWKTEMIAAYEVRGTATSLRDAICSDQAGAFGPSFTGPAPLLGTELRYFQLRGEAGWVRIGLVPAPRCTPDQPQAYVFIESAFESLNEETLTRPELWRLDPLPGRRNFGSDNDPDTNEWYVFDRTEMAGALGMDPEQVLDVWARSDLGMPSSLTQTPPARHLGYALTWFGLAVALIGVYLALHGARGRLRWR